MNTTSWNIEAELDEIVQKAMQTWNVPGLAVSVVKDDRTLIEKGYGVREYDKPDIVDEHTLFAIGSNTKSFTATAVGLLVQEGKIKWDDPVRRYLPDFQLFDPHTTDLITIRDLLCHRSGLGTWNGDMLLLSGYSTEEIVRRLRFIPPSYDFRAGYGYSNLMFITAGLIVSKVSGMSWDEFIIRRIFEPAGMTDSVTNPDYFADRRNIAAPHEDVKGKLQTLIQRGSAHFGAEGSICASIKDISLWLRLQLNKGSLDGRQIVDPAIIEEIQTPHTLIKLNPIDRKLFPSMHFSAYGLGWFLNDNQGRLVVRHTGGVDGMLSSTLLMPAEKLGIAVFSNKLPNSAFILLTHYLSEELTGLDPRDWIRIYLDINEEAKKETQQAQEKREASRKKDSSPSLRIEAYMGIYESHILGGASISLLAGQLHIQLKAHPSMSGKMEHWHYDTFLCHWDDPVLGESLLTFIGDGQGQVAEFHVKIREDWIDPLQHVFKKIGG